MFTKDRTPSSDAQVSAERSRPQPEGERRVAAWLGASIVVTGDLTSSEDMTIAGRVHGDVSVPEHALIIASGARIHGNILARAVVVHGEVKGVIAARERVEIGETARIEGDIVAPRMAILDGAALNARLRQEVPGHTSP
jgi:cytoskeletal protein CcmA (bactofilin family)